MKWEKREVDMLRELYASGKSVDEIAKQLNTTKGSVKNKAWRLGITNNKSYTDEEKQYIIDNYKSYNLQEIASKLNRPKENICRFARENGLERTGKKKEKSYYYTRLHSIYHSMKTRCYCVNSTAYKYYGGRGITICDEWLHDFKAFYDWAMSHGYKNDLTIDRINNDKGYSPDNCRWVTMKEQVNNRRCCKAKLCEYSENNIDNQI